MHVEPQVSAQIKAQSKPSSSWIALAALAWCALLFVWYWETTASIVSIWLRSETYTHGFVIVPIVLYLVWRDRDRLARIAPRPFPLALVGVALAGLAWLLGELASVGVVSQFALVAMVPFSVWTILGTEYMRALSFPLAFLFFAVPFGEALVPWLMDRTADFTVLALRMSGIPVYREGNSFVIPSGSWSIVEACSGIRYLIASMVGGALFARLMYRSRKRQLIFFGLSIVIPLVANWLRAYMIVMLGHITNNRLAVGVDHIIYGWIFFGVVMLLLFWIGSFWREDGDLPSHPGGGVGNAGVPTEVRRNALLVIFAATIALACVWKPFGVSAGATSFREAPQLGEVAAENGWERVNPTLLSELNPRYLHASAQGTQTFGKNGVYVGLYIGYYRNQVQGAEMVNSGNGLVATKDKVWRRMAVSTEQIGTASGAFRVRASELRGRSVSVDLVAWEWYWVDGKPTSSRYAAKAYLALAKLLRRGDDSAVIVVYAEQPEPTRSAEDTLARFVHDMAPSIERTLRVAQRS
jgi:exosortase A